ncbi:hypothetical protein [Bradyrhizobium sp. LHD-71]|uniref:hypothetical protein n=1 Tax=Bradyrhizobium sp. LHD-71 TaxID=3072141 RepID=UPI00280CEF0A|nr:hypothetical protein [Bradyrhizobium sp. LHD-71]MDQ8727509.1 hypothetical protein [Bradyrhizobium sp. LHD-71]
MRSCDGRQRIGGGAKQSGPDAGQAFALGLVVFVAVVIAVVFWRRRLANSREDPAVPRGCGAAVHLFGKPLRHLWLARSWFAFPRAAQGHNRVAVRCGHIFVLKEHVKGDVWLTTPTAAAGARGWTIVDPFAGRSAFASA